MAPALDATFLEEVHSRRPPRVRPVNVFDVLRGGWREDRVDFTLEFFLNPQERHLLGTLVIDALLRAIDGAAFIDGAGATDSVLEADRCLGTQDWVVATQVDYIDVYATSRELGIAIVIENKIGHVLNNPLHRYAGRARDDGFGTVLVVVLAPTSVHHIDLEQHRFVSKSLTYDELGAEITRSSAFVDALMAPASRDQQRSLDLLVQFIEKRSVEGKTVDIEDEAARVSEWWQLQAEHREAIRAFEQARTEVRRIIRDRRARLEPLIAGCLESAALAPDWEAHGGASNDVWNAYHFADPDWTVELKFTIDPDLVTAPVYVMDRRGRTYDDKTIEPLGLPWSSTDEEIADAFVQRVKVILDSVRAGTRPVRR